MNSQRQPLHYAEKTLMARAAPQETLVAVTGRTFVVPFRPVIALDLPAPSVKSERGCMV
jgi:hypothetical protein